MLEDDPDVLQELLEARHEQAIPGLLDLGKTWHALDIMLGGDKDAVLADAIVARTGKQLKAGSAHGKARLIGATRVAEIAKALAGLPPTMVTDRYASLYGKTVHGNYGQEVVSPDDKKWLRGKIENQQKAELEELTRAFAAVIELYTQAAAAKHSMISVII